MGALLALPVAAIIQAFVSTYVERYQVEESNVDGTDADGPAPPAPVADTRGLTGIPNPPVRSHT